MGAAAGQGASLGFLSHFQSIRRYEENRRAFNENERSYNMDAWYAEEVGKRKLNLLTREQDIHFDRQKAQLAKAGINFDGSSLDLLANTRAEQMREKQATDLDTKLKRDEAWRQASNERSKMNDADNNFMLDYMSGFLGSGVVQSSTRSG